jgi:hypothetical protein
VRSWYSQAAASSQFVAQGVSDGRARRCSAGERVLARPRTPGARGKHAGVRLRGRLLGRDRLGRRGETSQKVGPAEAAARDEADRKLDDSVEATVRREAAHGPALPLTLLVPDRPLTEGRASDGHELRREPPAAPSCQVVYSCSSRSRSRSTPARRPV